MKKIIVLLVFALLLSACSQKQNQKLNIVTTNSILGDMAHQVAGQDANVHSIVPIGQDPHEYEVKPQDVAAIADADVIIYNGLNLESGNSWFRNALEEAGKSMDDDNVVVASKKVDKIYLEQQKSSHNVDPHAWLSINNGIKYVDAIKSALIHADPKHKERYNTNADEYKSQLEKLSKTYAHKFDDIAHDKRILITSEGAFKYFSKDYDITHRYIWEINTEKQGTPEQMKNIVDFVKHHPVKSLYVETSVDKRSMQALSAETGKPIAGEVYTDSLGKKGSDGDTYYKMMEHNIKVIHAGMADK